MQTPRNPGATLRPRRSALVFSLLLVATAATASAAATQSSTDPCPMLGWPELLPGMLKPGAAFPTDDTKELNAPDCAFHQWSWEAFAWATALDADGVPRFMKLPTPADLLNDSATAGTIHARPLKLGLRPIVARSAGNGFAEDAGAIVEADGNMLVAPNGYPVYASVHMNLS